MDTVAEERLCEKGTMITLLMAPVTAGLVCFYTSMFGTQEYVFWCVPRSVISRTRTQKVLHAANYRSEFSTSKII